MHTKEKPYKVTRSTALKACRKEHYLDSFLLFLIHQFDFFFFKYETLSFFEILRTSKIAIVEHVSIDLFLVIISCFCYAWFEMIV